MFGTPGEQIVSALDSGNSFNTEDTETNRKDTEDVPECQVFSIPDPYL
jgi:hypothetical protein